MTSLSHAENRDVSRHARPLLPFHLSFHGRVAAAAVTPFVRPRLSLGPRRAVLAFCTNFLPVASPSLRDRDRRHCRLSYRQLSVCRVCDSIEARWRHRPAAEHVCGILYQFAVAYIQPCRSSSFIMRRHRREAIGEAIAIKCI